MRFFLFLSLFVYSMSASAMCDTPWADIVPQGLSVEAFEYENPPPGKTCIDIMEKRTCKNSVLSGSYKFGYCDQYKNCKVGFGETPVSSGETIDLYIASKETIDEPCKKETRLCDKGFLRGDEAYSEMNCLSLKKQKLKLAKDYKMNYEQAVKSGNYEILNHKNFKAYRKLLKSQGSPQGPQGYLIPDGSDSVSK